MMMMTTTTTTTTSQQNIHLNNNTAGPKPRGRRKKVRTEPVRPVCPQCEKQFSNQSALTKHKLTHSDERKFACQQCSKAFKRHDHLTGHMQTHSNRKPFNCDVQGCDKTYCDARSLRRHKENIHHIVTPKENSNSSNSNLSAISSSSSSSSATNNQHSHSHSHNQQQQQVATAATSSSLGTHNHQNIHYESQHPPQLLTPQPVKVQDISSNTIIDNNNNNNSTPTYHQQAQQQHYQQQQQHQTLVLQQSNNLASPQVQQQQPSQLYRRRLNSDGGIHEQVAGIEINTSSGCMGQPSNSNQNPHTFHHVTHHQHQQHHHHQHQHHQQHHQQQHLHHPPYSADYASSQTFFGHNYVHQVDSSHSLSSNTIPHSADSVTDSVLGLNIHQYDQQQQQLTPQPQLTPDMNIHYEPAPPPQQPPQQHQQHQLQQQPPQLTPQPVSADGSCSVGVTTIVDSNNNTYNQPHYQQQQHDQRLVLPPSNNQVQQPSELYKRRLHRLHSDGGGVHDRIEINVNSGGGHLGNMGQLGHNHHSVTMHHHHHQHHQNNNHHHHPSYSADYASTTTFFGQSYMQPIETSHPLNGTSIPHSADSVTDSGLALNIHYEQPQFEFTSHS